MDKSNKHGGRGVEEKSGQEGRHGASDAEQKRREDEKEPSGTGKKNSQSAETVGSDSSKSARPRK